jgi:hypothetical protein
MKAAIACRSELQWKPVPELLVGFNLAPLDLWGHDHQGRLQSCPTP